MMKKIKLLILTILFPTLMFSQGGVEIVPFAGYMFSGSVKYQATNGIGNEILQEGQLLTHVGGLVNVTLNSNSNIMAWQNNHVTFEEESLVNVFRILSEV